MAYGPVSTGRERAEAEAALRTLKAAEVTDQPLAASGAEGNPITSPVTDDGVGPAATQSIWRRRIRLGWLIPVTVGALILGVVGTLVSTGQIVLSSSQPKTIVVTLPEVDASGPGDLEAAKAWFDKPSEPGNTFPDTKLLGSLGIDPADVKSATAVDIPQGALWIARKGPTRFCMIAFTYVKDPATVTNCVSVNEFRESGLSVVTPFYAAHWDGIITQTNR